MTYRPSAQRYTPRDAMVPQPGIGEFAALAKSSDSIHIAESTMFASTRAPAPVA
mgnify:CR=1 FL=1